MKIAFTLLAALIMGTGMILPLQPAMADEWEESSPYYEDDAWYDISEWFDGNDYNPTDESFGRWDDETYDAWEDVGTDQDNDYWYGYNTASRDDDWFYDYYDPGDFYYDYSYGDYVADYPYTSRYYDYDNDGSYDAYVSYYDWNNDGIYEDVDFLTFNDKSTKEQQAQVQKEKPDSSKMRTVSGKIQDLKQVQTRSAKHTVARIGQDDKPVMVDLGPEKNLTSLNLKAGDQITVKGPVTKVGDQQVVVAMTVEGKDNKQHRIDRTRNTITGKVVDTHKVQIRKRDNLVAVIEAKDRGKIAVDLGPAKNFDMDLKKGDKLTFSGVAVQVKDRKLMMAQSVQQEDGEMKPIRRQSDKKQQQQQTTAEDKNQ